MLHNPRGQVDYEFHIALRNSISGSDENMIADLAVDGAGAGIQRDAVVGMHAPIVDGHGDAEFRVEGLFGRFVFYELDLGGARQHAR